MAKLALCHDGRSLAVMYRSGCRCEQCVSWQRKRYLATKESVVKRVKSGEIKHGTGMAYDLGQCRCPLCLEFQRKKRCKLAANGNRHVRRNQWKVRGMRRGGFDFTYSDYELLWNEQRQRCAICEKPVQIIKSKEGNAAAVDHDHNTGEVRGLLCMKCNMGVGQFNDNAQLLHKAARYLENSCFPVLNIVKTA